MLLQEEEEEAMLAVSSLSGRATRRCAPHIHTFDSTGWVIIPHSINWGGRREKTTRVRGQEKCYREDIILLS